MHMHKHMHSLQNRSNRTLHMFVDLYIIVNYTFTCK